VDPQDFVYEITEVNNGATVLIGGTAPSYPPPMLLQLDPAATTPGGTVTVRGRNFQPGVIALASDAPTPWLAATFLDAQTLSLAVDPLAPPAVYLFSVRNPDGKSSNLLPLTVAGPPDTVRPAEVAGLRLARNFGQLVFSWDPVTTDVDGDPESLGGYEIWRGRLPDFGDAVSWQTTTGITLGVRNEAVWGAGTAYYRVRARDAAGNLGD